MSRLTGLLDRIVEGLVPRRGPEPEPLRISTTLRAGPRPAPPSSPGRLWIRGQPAPHNPRRLSPCVDRPVDNYSLVFPHLCPQMWMNHSSVLSALSFKASRAARCFSGAVHLMCCLLASETLARAGARGRLVVLEAAMRGGKRSGRSLVSTALTSTLHRRRTPKKNRRIPTIPTGRVDGWIVHVSAVDTGPRGSESGVLGGRARRRRGVGPPPQLPPTLRRLPHPAPATWVPSHVTNVMTSNIELYLAPARRPAGHGSMPTPPAPSRLHPAPTPSRPESAYSTRVGIY